MVFPDWMIRTGVHRRCLEWLLPKSYSTLDMIHGQFIPFVIKKIKQHEETFGLV